MEWDAIKANWKRISPSAQSRWPDLTEAILEAVGGDRKALNDALVKAYRVTADEANAMTQEFGLRQTAQDGDAKPAASEHKPAMGGAIPSAPIHTSASVPKGPA